MLSIEAKIESILFWKGEEVSFKEISKILDIPIDSIKTHVENLKDALENRGVFLIIREGKVVMRTHPDATEEIEKLQKDDLEKDLGKAGLETLSIVLYKGPITRAGIDYIRGVNSNFILRNLAIRGLIEKVDNPEDKRSNLYQATSDLLSFLGISSIDELPEYERASEEVDNFIESKKDLEGTKTIGESSSTEENINSNE